MKDKIMCDCGHLESECSECTRGYGTDKDGKTSCYDCCTAFDKAQLRTASRIVQYISGDGRHLINWPGRIIGQVRYRGELHPWSRERYYIRVRDCHGQQWSGVGAAGMYATLRKVRG